MGLGKTLQVMYVVRMHHYHHDAEAHSGTIVGNPPEPGLGLGKTTLLVVPSGAIKQWEEEIQKHVSPNLLKKITHYKRTKEITRANLDDQDIISMISPLQKNISTHAAHR